MSENSGLSNITFPRLFEEMVRQIRFEAEKTYRGGGFKYGAIRIVFCPKTQKALDFLGGFSGENMSADFGAPIADKGEMVLPQGYWREADKEVDCYAVSGMKVHACMHAVQNDLGRRSSDCSDDRAMSVWSNKAGCVVFDIVENHGTEDEGLFMRIYVSVDGGFDGEEDESCALDAGYVLKTWCRSYAEEHNFPKDSLVVVTPEKKSA